MFLMCLQVSVFSPFFMTLMFHVTVMIYSHLKACATVKQRHQSDARYNLIFTSVIMICEVILKWFLSMVVNNDAEHVLTSHCRGTSQQRNVNVVTVYDIQNKFIGTNKSLCTCTVAVILLCFKQVAYNCFWLRTPESCVVIFVAYWSRCLCRLLIQSLWDNSNQVPQINSGQN